jgi:putative DNA primase/helicase
MNKPLPGATRIEMDVFVSPPLEPMPLPKFLRLDIPPRLNLLSPIIAEKSINMLFGPRGCGKTHLGVGIAVAVATGTRFLRWDAEQPRRVLYIDGEMPAAALIDRFKAATADVPNFSFAEIYLAILASDLRPDGLPDLSTLEGQERFAPSLEGYDLIIVDNISTLCRTGKENEAESWGILQSWALTQRRAGRSVLFMHHAGKGGEQRGTSRREDIMDTVIKLSRPADYKASEGARMIVEFSKARGIMGKDAEAFEAQLKDGSWTERSAVNVRDQSIIALHLEGLSQHNIAKDVGCGAGTVNRVIKAYNSGAPIPDNDD